MNRYCNFKEYCAASYSIHALPVVCCHKLQTLFTRTALSLTYWYIPAISNCTFNIHIHTHTHTHTHTQYGGGTTYRHIKTTTHIMWPLNQNPNHTHHHAQVCTQIRVVSTTCMFYTNASCTLRTRVTSQENAGNKLTHAYISTQPILVPSCLQAQMLFLQFTKFAKLYFQLTVLILLVCVKHPRTNMNNEY